jgi:hypothetical protein
LNGQHVSSIREVMKNNEKIRVSFSFATQIAKITAKNTAIVRDKVLINVEKALNFWVVYMNKNRVPL